jgi:uncharacterized membrane protein YbhN (UPF0104 family)
MKIKDFIRLTISLVIIACIIFYLYTNNYFDIIYKIQLADWFILIGLTLCGYLLSGVQMYYLVRFVNGKGISIADLFFMPMSMNLFGYFIPTNGGFLYAVYFLKKKYQVETSRGFSVGVFSIYISFIISGLALLIAVLYLHFYSIYFIILSALMILSPLLVYYMNMLIQKIPTRKESFPDKVKTYFNSVVLHSNKMIANKKIMAINMILTLISLVVLFLMYYRLNQVLMINMPLLSVIALIVMMRISGLIRLLPGNLGLEELFTAGLFGIIGNDPSIGLVFSVFLRFCAVVIMIPAGVTHTTFNSKYFNLKDLKKILRRKNISQDEASTKDTLPVNPENNQ